MLSFEKRHDRPAWGRVQRPAQEVATPRFRDEVERFATADREPRLAVGLRRSYGDVCLSSLGRVLDMAGLDRFISFDAATGLLRAEAGISLSQILRFAVPRGFFLPVTPGTRFVTLGGAIANDVHGKNHHRAGTFGCHVTRIGLVRSGRGLLEIGPEDGELFAATVGGLGLTGVILWAEIRLTPIASATIDGEALPFGSLDDFLRLARESEASHEFTVAWVDCSRREGEVAGVFFRGDWSREGGLRTHEDRGPGVPFDAPAKLLNPLTLAAFNRAYRALHGGAPKRFRKHYQSFFYPLDGIGGWNRLYGRAGFFQYQCVVPYAEAGAIAALVRRIARSGQGSFLSVLKTFGERPSPGLLSFPRPGVTLALDLPNRGEETLALLHDLDGTVREAGGRLYPAKDGRMPPQMFRAGYPQLDRFLPQIDPSMQSDFARRVLA
jgi:FAD/FMN-containing dehydrogenase